MWKAAHDEDIAETKLQEYLENWGLWGGEQVFDDWLVFRRSGYVVLPFAGGWRDQPWWIRQDFTTLDLVRAYFDKQADKPSLDNVIDPFEDWIHDNGNAKAN